MVSKQFGVWLSCRLIAEIGFGTGLDWAGEQISPMQSLPGNGDCDQMNWIVSYRPKHSRFHARGRAGM
jgi:hypothetical protein